MPKEYVLEEDKQGKFGVMLDGICIERFNSKSDAIDVLNLLNNCQHEVSWNAEHTVGNEVKVTCEYCGKSTFLQLPTNAEWEHE